MNRHSRKARDKLMDMFFSRVASGHHTRAVDRRIMPWLLTKAMNCFMIYYVVSGDSFKCFVQEKEKNFADKF